MPKQTPLVTGFYRDGNRHWSRQDCLNMLPIAAEKPGTLTPMQLRQVAGCRPFVQIGSRSGDVFTAAGINRGLRNVEGKLFAVAGNKLWQITNAGVSVPIGTIPGVGRVSMAHNAKGQGNELLTVNGSAGYVYNTQTLAFGKVTDTGYPGAFVADFVDQYLAQVEPGGRYWFHSDIADAHAYNTLDQYQAEGDPDRIVSLLVSHREVLAFGRDTIEPYVNAPSGDGTAPFERASNTVIEVGCAARFTPRRMDSSAFWLDDQRLIRRLDGYTPAILSTDPVAEAFAECTEAEISQAYAFTWEPKGHKVYYVTVPGRFTFGYDAKTREWHRRNTYGLPHWAIIDIAYWNGQWIAADSRNSNLYRLDDAYALDGCEPIERVVVAPVLWAEQGDITVNSVELMLDAAGQSVGCVEFPDQPAGPAMSGSAPDGSVSIVYSYGYTVTSGSAPITTVQIVSGELLSGLSWNSSTATISGTPTAAGTMDLQFKATDANGLWAIHEDSIRVRAVWEWADDFGNNLHDVASDGEARFLAVGSGLLGVGEIWATDQVANTWTDMSALNTPNWPLRSLDFGNGQWVISGDSGNVLVIDQALTESAQNATSNGSAYLVTRWTGQRWLRMGFGGNAEYAANPLGTWTSISVGVSETVRHALVNRETERVLAFTENGTIRRSVDGGLTWGGATINGTDPSPGNPFTGVSELAGIIRAYKTINSSSFAVYTSIDDGATFDAAIQSAVSGAYNGGQTAIVDGEWGGGGSAATAPNYPRIYFSADGLSPFTVFDFIPGPPTVADSQIVKVLDGGFGTGVAIGQYSGGANFAYRYRYST
ncbi:packaged DNA stabilization protein [Pseudoxanthomonas koreensis]|uniref:packaged DNA stabilization protein n=1 Tax=Pseudoxanthomonas koreensis TaxID=266061 RepID=UPI001390A89D|nr:packaged DNA stabilization protein [Pseudoxanthomonas koreensis]KAF1692655.1 hypothetical protein CSC64_06615 [Pseudoxanthomonas koreensis]